MFSSVLNSVNERSYSLNRGALVLFYQERRRGVTVKFKINKKIICEEKFKKVYISKMSGAFFFENIIPIIMKEKVKEDKKIINNNNNGEKIKK